MPKTTWCGGLKTAASKLQLRWTPDIPLNWPRNMFIWRSNILGSSGKGHDIPQAPAGHHSTACRARIWAAGRQAPGVPGTTKPRGKLGPAGDAGLPHEHHLPVFRHRAAHGHLVREERPQHQRHAPPSSTRCRRPWIPPGSAQRLGDLQRLRQSLQRAVCVRPPGRGAGGGAQPIMHDTPASWPSL